ncbi:Detected protein of confused Function [Hibiscus syriacus]|uniref:Detected protein of confused Function n=1 Tax=Hibiscus syriacus TaxID=106335 RepID=A0A6A2ZUZ9_HIBSY|nr:late embryogenesis abundant protein At1g64065-like [Hibiscus syriacus]KAE8695543.1 Detected protein of confused Function [Hibiscus syriacus]
MEVESLRNKIDKSSVETPPRSSDAAIVVRNRRKWRNVCFAVIGVLVFIVVLIVILAFTVFKAKRPVTTIDDVSLRDLKVSVDLARFQVLLNATLDVDISIKNPNKVGFKFKDSNAQLNYRGQQVGEVPIPAGKISADKTVPMNLTLTVMADRLISDSKFFSDVTSGELPLSTKTEIPGKVSVLNMFRISVVSSSSCDFTVFISNSSVGDQNCKYKTKF